MTEVTRVTLESFAIEHLPLLERWLRSPHVSPWYPQPQRDMAFATDPPTNAAQALIVADQWPVGYLRWCHVDRQTLDELGLDDVPSNSVDIDILIGEPAYAACGVGPRALQGLAQRLLPDAAVPMLGLTTSARNVRAQRAFRKAGFEISRQYDPNGLGVCHLMLRDLRRERGAGRR